MTDTEKDFEKDSMESQIPTQSEDFFTEAETALNIKIPLILKNLLIINGFENETIISNINDSDIKEITLFARNELHKIIDEENLPKYYGPYWKNPSLFQIVPGHKNIIILLSEYYKKKLLKKDNLKKMCEIKKKSIKEKEERRQILIESNSNLTEATSQSFFTISDEMENNLSSSEKLEAMLLKENETIRKAIISWTQGKVNRAGWENLRELFDNIIIITSMEKDELKCVITCFCGSNYTISKFSKKNSNSKRWIYSNFQTHLLKKHIQNINSSTTKVISKNNLITNYVSNMPKSPNVMLCQNIEFTDTESVGKTSHCKDILKINVTDNTVNTIDAVLDTESITDLQNINEKCETDNSILDSISIIDFDAASNPISIINLDIDSNNQTEKISEDDIRNIPSCSNVTTDIQCKEVSKFQSLKYQRSERLKRAREKLNPNQILITDYFILAEKVAKVLNDNVKISENFLSRIKKPEINSNTEDNGPVLCSFLKKLLDISLINSKHSTNKNFYDDATKKFGIYLYYTGGRLLYETLHANLPNVLPSITTLNRYSSINRQHTEEGEIDFIGLVQYLNERNVPKVIWISEDATRITGKIEYDSRSNKVLGFALPLKNGLPEQNKYIATSAETIQNFFKVGNKATYAYVIMAQPLSYNVPAYCLSLFSTDNKFDTKNVLERWNFMKEEAKKFGITIAGFLSDGDTRLLKAMRLNNSLPITSNEIFPWSSTWPWFQINMNKVEECYIQDTTHIITKMRTRFLKEGVILPIGDYFATVDHLHYLMKNVSKDKHLLTSLDLKGEDKMNYLAGAKMCSSSVISHLKQITNSNGTIAYLNIMNFVILSFLDESIVLSARVYYLWYTVFFLRIWKAWIKRNKNYTIKDNFITNNCYLCIELNAHNLIKLIILFKNNSQIFKPTMFHLTNFSSQTCEKLFRAARSMTSTYSTVINFSIKDLIYRINRIKQINAITNDLSGIFLFPREDKKKSKIQNVPTYKDIQDLNIKEIVENALKDVIEETKKLGIKIENDEDWKFIDIPFQKLESEFKRIPCDDDADYEIDNNYVINNDIIDTNVENVDNAILSDNCNSDELGLKSLELKDFSKQIPLTSITENSPFIKVQIDNKTMIIKKSSYCWLLDECKGKISADRLRRFITSDKTSTKRKKNYIIQSKKKSQFSNSKDGDVEYLNLEDKAEFLFENESKVSEILSEKYYAVFYDNKYYIGRVIEYCDKHNVKIKFLKAELNSFVWPRDEDIAVIETKFIFYGPIDLIGNGPFTLKQSDLLIINKMYKSLKSKLHK